MMWFGHPITVTVRRGGTDPRTGDPLPGSEHQITGCAVAPRTSAETTDLGNAVVVGLTLYAPFDADLEATDEVVLPDDPTPWQVEGEPGRWRNPHTGWAPGMQAALTRQRG